MSYIPEEKIELNLKMSSVRKAIESVRNSKSKKEIKNPEIRETVN